MTLRSTISAKPQVWATALAIAVAVALLAYVFGRGGYVVTVMGFAVIYGVFVTGLNLFMGYAGQASFGQNAFAALGGYGTAVLCADYGLEPIVALVLSATLSAVIALIVGYPTLRLRGHYLAMATFALGLITYELSIEQSGLTRGFMGFSGIPPLGLGRFQLLSERAQLAVFILIMLLGVWVARRLRGSRFGRALLAIGESEPAANALGIQVFRYKLVAFVIAAVYASVAGSMFAHFVGYISPEVFGLSMVTLSFTMLYVGGIGTLWGPIAGAVLVSFLPQLLRGFRDMQDIIYCLALIVILIFVPKGLASLWSLAVRRSDVPAER
ncbi:MAG: branched-chain amino acid ABC transporter permease [Proteobacteria bacterium]|nr:branched-chain amino acid ABC transporter permease [Pseudomonadota bacterium]